MAPSREPARHVKRGGDVAPDGQSLVLVIPEPTPADTAITLVRNWPAAIRKSD